MLLLNNGGKAVLDDTSAGEFVDDLGQLGANHGFGASAGLSNGAGEEIVEPSAAAEDPGTTARSE